MQRIHSLFRKTITSLLVVYLTVSNFSLVANATEGNQELAIAADVAAQTAVAPDSSKKARTAEQPAPTETAVAIVEIQDYSLASGSIGAGESVEIEVHLHNLSNTTRAAGVMMTISSSSGKAFPSFGQDNQIYVGSISAGGTATAIIPITISSSFSGEYVDLTCRIDYESNNKATQNTATMILPAASGADMIVQSVGLSSKAIVNSNTLLSINYANKSKRNIEDAALVIEGNVTSESSRIKLGSAYAEKSYMKDYHITFTEVGRQDINIYLTYTNSNGETITSGLGSYSVDVSEQSESEAMSNHVSSTVIWIGRLIAVLAGIVALIAVMIYIRRR
jgi:hypothetical protein